MVILQTTLLRVKFGSVTGVTAAQPSGCATAHAESQEPQVYDNCDVSKTRLYKTSPFPESSYFEAHALIPDNAEGEENAGHLLLPSCMIFHLPLSENGKCKFFFFI